VIAAIPAALTGNQSMSSTNSANMGGPLTQHDRVTTTIKTKLLYTGHNWDNTQTLNPPTGMTERFDELVYLADEERLTAGATGNRTQALPVDGAWAAFLIALKGTTGVEAYTLTAIAGSYTLTGTAVSFASAVSSSILPVFRAAPSYLARTTSDDQ
jgi:hypothetical protein